MSEQLRPKRVVVVDAENPLAEIRGEFFWREDHDRIVADVREEAYARGYADGVAATGRASAAQSAQTLVVRFRRGLLRRTVTAVLVVFLVVAFAVSLIGSMVGSVHSP